MSIDLVTFEKNLLHPTLQCMATVLQWEAQQNKIRIKFISGFRSIEVQNKLYAQGRTTPGAIVTEVSGGFSYHNYGLAFDFVVVDSNDVELWNDVHDFCTVGLLAERIGMTWGGRFRSRDYGHCQYSFGFKIAELVAGLCPKEILKGGAV